MVNQGYSPFSPGSPLLPELFVGRIEQIMQVQQYIHEAKSGKQENVFLTGDRGIGKSSFASFLRHWALSNENILGIHVYLGGVTSLEEMVRHIFDRILKETKEYTWFSKIKDFFGEHIEKVGLFGVSANFSPPQKDLRSLVKKFPEALNNLIDKIKNDKTGIFIAMDDINGLAEGEEFAHWYKSFVDEVATHYDNFPLFIMLIGLPEKRKLLSSSQPSLMRIFRPVEIEKLNINETKEFLSNAFATVNIKVDNDALETMVKFSNGLPILMHEIGDAVFRIDTDGTINENDALKGLYNAAQIVGKKYLEPKVYAAIQSTKYKSILRKLGEELPNRTFTKSELEKKLTANEKKEFHHFLGKMRTLGVIESDAEKGRGYYRFVNEIYPLYIWIESSQSKKK